MSRYLLKSAALSAALLLGLAPGAAAQGNCQPGAASATLDANQVSAKLYNNGNLFFNGGSGEYEVPKGSGLVSIFAAGIWAGGTVDGELRTSAATYAQGSGYEMWPGPLTDGAPPDDCAAFDRIYLVSQADIDAYDAGGAATPDLAEWPADLGAPVEDGDGDPDNYDLAAGDRPNLQDAAQSAWWVMNDVGNAHTTTLTPPIGLEVRVQALSYTADDGETPDFFETSTFYEYTFIYEGEGTLEEFYTTLWLDADVGNFTDDYVGSVPELGLGYTYNADDDDEGVDGYGIDPPAIGVLGFFAEVGDAPVSRVPFLQRGGQRSVTSSVMYYNNVNNTPQGNPDGGQNYYDLQRARWLDGTRLVTGADGYYQSAGATNPTAYAFSGAPPDFWSEYDTLPTAGAQPNAAGDRRFLQSFGPFTLESGEAVVLGTGILWAREAGGGAIGSRDALLNQASVLFDGGAFEPEPIFGNSLAPLSVTVPRNQTESLVFPIANTGGADLTVSLVPGDTPGSEFLDLVIAPSTISPGDTFGVGVEVSPDGAAVGTYAAEIRVTSNDRNVVSAAIPVEITVTMAVAGEEGAAGRFALAAPRPNPAAGTSRLEYEIATAGPVRLSVIDVLGREVMVAVDGTRAVGAHTADLDLGALPSGLYVVRLQAGDQEATQRLTVVR